MPGWEEEKERSVYTYISAMLSLLASTQSNNNNNSDNDLATPLLLEDEEHNPQPNDRAPATTQPPRWRTQQQQQQQQQQLTAMLSNLTASYNVVSIGYVLPILIESDVSSSKYQSSALAGALLLGMIFGPLLAGSLCAANATRGMHAAMGVQLVATIASAVVVLMVAWNSTNNNPSTITAQDIFIRSTTDNNNTTTAVLLLCTCRFLVGIGAGAVYPLAAKLSSGCTSTLTTTSNNNNDSSPSSLRRIVLTFSMQGIGFVLVPVVSLAALYGCSTKLHVVAAILLGFGSVPAALVLILHAYYYSCKNSKRNDAAAFESREDLATSETLLHGTAADETETSMNYYGQVNLDTDVAAPLISAEGAQDSSNYDTTTTTNNDNTVTWWASIRQEPRLVSKLTGTAATWFLLDMLFYGNTLFQPLVLKSAFGESSTLQQTYTKSLILATIALPGYSVAAATLGSRTQTTRFVMMQGFAMLSILYVVLGTWWDQLEPSILLAVYALTFFFCNYGPNTATFVLPSLVYTKQHAVTFNGVSAAAGKVGALLGAVLFAPAANEYGSAAVMLLCSGIAVVAFALTALFVPDV
jgi:PHS family inorganic phosphate transporter-like MFS transporter